MLCHFYDIGQKDSSDTDDTPNPTEPWKNFRLPENILPTHYDITLKPNIPEDINYGHEIIEVDVVKPTSTVIIHALAGGFTGSDLKEFPLEISRENLQSKRS